MDWFTNAFPVVQAFDEEVIRAGFRPAQMVLVAFLVTFGCVRFYTHSVRHGRGPGNLSVGGLRVHHMVPGIFLLLGAGFIAITADDDSLPWYLWWVLPTAFGVGAALVLDEFALWLNLRDVYWTEEGRRSIDAVIIAAALIAHRGAGGAVLGQGDLRRRPGRRLPDRGLPRRSAWSARSSAWPRASCSSA